MRDDRRIPKFLYEEFVWINFIILPSAFISLSTLYEKGIIFILGI
jgi:hypothetical protein